jgi:hypothetical protein
VTRTAAPTIHQPRRLAGAGGGSTDSRTSAPCCRRYGRRARQASRRTGFNRCDESVAALRKRFDEAWALGGIAERLAEPVDRFVQAAVEVNKGVSRPQPPLQFLARDHLGRPLEQKEQDLERLIPQSDFDTPACAVRLTGDRLRTRQSGSLAARRWASGTVRFDYNAGPDEF